VVLGLLVFFSVFALSMDLGCPSLLPTGSEGLSGRIELSIAPILPVGDVDQVFDLTDVYGDCDGKLRIPLLPTGVLLLLVPLEMTVDAS